MMKSFNKCYLQKQKQNLIKACILNFVDVPKPSWIFVIRKSLYSECLYKWFLSLCCIRDCAEDYRQNEVRSHNARGTIGELFPLCFLTKQAVGIISYFFSALRLNSCFTVGISTLKSNLMNGVHQQLGPILSYITAVPQPFWEQEQVCGGRFFHTPGLGGWGNVFRKIQKY